MPCHSNLVLVRGMELWDIPALGEGFTGGYMNHNPQVMSIKIPGLLVKRIIPQSCYP